MNKTAKKLNGNLTWIITTLAGIIASAAVLVYVVKEMRPEVKLNTEHRISDEATDVLILDKLDQLLRK